MLEIRIHYSIEHGKKEGITRPHIFSCIYLLIMTGK